MGESQQNACQSEGLRKEGCSVGPSNDNSLESESFIATPCNDRGGLDKYQCKRVGVKGFELVVINVSLKVNPLL